MIDYSNPKPSWRFNPNGDAYIDAVKWEPITNPPTCLLGTGVSSRPGDLRIGDDRYERIFIGETLVWARGTGFVWDRTILTLGEAIIVQQHHINALNRALRQDFDAPDLGLPASVEHFLSQINMQ